MTAMTEALEPHFAPTTGAISFGAEPLEIANAKWREQANAQAVELAQRLETEQRLPTTILSSNKMKYAFIGSEFRTPNRNHRKLCICTGHLSKLSSCFFHCYSRSRICFGIVF
jgi:hypothetical protein